MTDEQPRMTLADILRGAADRILAYRSRVPGGDLLCLEHAPSHPERNVDWMALTSEDLPDGGMCTTCGVDVLIG